MDNASWTDILAAESAFWSAIFSGLSLGATVGGVIVARLALRWAHTAAVEAGNQAAAALKALEWAQKAAEAAQDQIKLLEKQIAMLEPRPVINVSLQYAPSKNQPYMFSSPT